MKTKNLSSVKYTSFLFFPKLKSLNFIVLSNLTSWNFDSPKNNRKKFWEVIKYLEDLSGICMLCVFKTLEKRKKDLTDPVSSNDLNIEFVMNSLEKDWIFSKSYSKILSEFIYL